MDHEDGGGGPSEREQFSVAFAGMPDHQLAVGGPLSDSFGGTDAADHYWGLDAGDRLGGGPEGDVLTGGKGPDLLSGGEGMDHLHGEEGDDTLYGAADADALMGGPGNDYLDEGPGHSSMDGEEGNDILVGGTGPDAFVVRPGSGDDVVRDFTAGPGVGDHIALQDIRWEDLSVDDTEAGVKISWEGGSVLLEGMRKSELSQDDFMFFNRPDLPPGTRAPEGPTEERPSPSEDGPGISGVLPPADDSLVPGPGEEARTLAFDRYAAIIGTDDGERLRGSDDWDQIFGRDGDDLLVGKGGDDVLDGAEGNDRLRGGDGPDQLEGGPGDDTLHGGAENDELMGGDGNDLLAEGPGHGMLEGGRGDDTFVGGAGSDAFMVSSDSGNDVVLDFRATGLAQGLFDHIAFMDIEAADVAVEDTGQGARVAWDVDHDGTDDGSILLVGVARDDLRQSDFMFDTPQFVAGINDYGSWYIFG
ncbi:calcium-binding protein [Siccirubricoccus sp. KC 17139]|uniref:Calcium-binding protein n=1 Tax=Siccirubricoccus soli TaxID=2899147 RepID=A0ABT1D2P0_9PROT|nr:calcium-binding protein [Siccirubricoccus soli]MCO6416198.1 calcium-binding protein [Siccirubricoccus soli]MCP2682332.1 calcium-binding protein [Siccirubricoccus soli]